MTGKIGLTDVMDAIYFASHQKDGWQDCLDLISKISGGETSQLLMLNKDSGQLVAAYQSRIPAMQGQGHDEQPEGTAPQQPAQEVEAGPASAETPNAPHDQ